MTPRVNGNGGNDKNAMDAIKAYLEALRTKGAGKTEKTDDTAATLTPPVKPEVTEEELLSADYRSYFGAKFSTDPAEVKRNQDLAALPQTSLAGVTRADRKEAFNAVDNPLVQAYMYGPMSESTSAFLSQFDGTSFPPEVTDNLLAEVVIDAV